LEGELVDHTLWPEVAKLFGHPNGVTCLAASPDGGVLASACKARDAAAACVRFWDTVKTHFFCDVVRRCIGTDTCPVL
jgi:elongator complex protein 2